MTVHIDMKYDKSLTETNKIYRAILIVKFHSARIQYLRDSKTDPKDPEIGLTELLLCVEYVSVEYFALCSICVLSICVWSIYSM